MSASASRFQNHSRFFARRSASDSQLTTGATEQIDGPSLAGGVDQFQRLERGVAVGPGVGQAVLFQPQRGFLLGVLQVGVGDLFDLVAQDVGFTGPLLGITTQSGQRLVERVQLAPDGPDPTQIGPGESVEDVSLCRGRHESTVLVLTVDLDQLRGGLAQGGERGHAPVDPGPGPALGGDRAGEEDLDEAGAHPGLRPVGAHFDDHAQVY